MRQRFASGMLLRRRAPGYPLAARGYFLSGVGAVEARGNDDLGVVVVQASGKPITALFQPTRQGFHGAVRKEPEVIACAPG